MEGEGGGDDFQVRAVLRRDSGVCLGRANARWNRAKEWCTGSKTDKEERRRSGERRERRERAHRLVYPERCIQVKRSARDEIVLANK